MRKLNLLAITLHQLPFDLPIYLYYRIHAVATKTNLTVHRFRVYHLE